jgi:hypothetical protein
MKTFFPFPCYLVSFALFLALPSCQGADNRLLAGNGQVVVDKKSLAHFENIELIGLFCVTLTRGNNPHVIVESDSSLKEPVDIQVKEGSLTISQETKEGQTINIRDNQDLNLLRTRITITYPKLTRVTILGSSNLRSTEPVESRELTFDISGAAKIDLVVNTRILRTNLAGGGKIRLEGEAGKHYIELAGASLLESACLITRETRIALSGAGLAEVHATDLLEANMNGIGSIRYFGNPKVKRISPSILGTIRRGN